MQLLLLKQDRSQQKENLAAREYGVCRPPSLSPGTQPPAGRRRRGRAGPNSAATRSGVGRGPCHRQALGAGGTRPWGSSPSPPQAGTTASSPLGAGPAAQTRPLIPDYLPQQWQLLHALWTLEAVAELIRQQCGQELSRQAVGNYLRAWGSSCPHCCRMSSATASRVHSACSSCHCCGR